MAKGVSIHAGINVVDHKKNRGVGALPCCVNDALAMRDIATENGFDWLLLLNEKATRARLVNALEITSEYLEPGDLLLLTFSGHGDWQIDKNLDEIETRDNDNKDEAWVMYDGSLVDDQLFEIWKKFKPGVRIVVISDSCHSGTITMNAHENDPGPQPDYEGSNPNSIWGEKWVHLVDTEYQGMVSVKNDIGASVMLLAACDEREVIPADAGSGYSLFTDLLLRVWDKGSFNGNYKSFLDAIAKKMPVQYHPQYLVIGAVNKTFERQKPFRIY